MRLKEVPRASGSGGKAKAAAPAGRAVAAARQSPLDRVKSVLAATANLRQANGNLSAARVSKLFGVSVSQLTGWLRRTSRR